jgi:CRP-like cAMP-binding protein
MQDIEGAAAAAMVLRKLRREERRTLSATAIAKTYSAGQIIAHHGDTWPYLLLLQRGLIVIRKISADGRFLGAMRLQGGDTFWSPSLLDGGPLPASLEARRSCTTLQWRDEDILPLIKRNADAEWDLIQVLMRQIRQASDYVEELSFQPVAGRLARLILAQFEGSSDLQIERSMTLDEMAAMIGTTPVMVCKLLSRFAREEMIKVSRTDIVLVDRQQLEELSGP